MKHSGAENSMALARKKAKLLQKDVADMLGVHRSSIAKWETGVAMPRAGTLVKLAKLYGCTIDDLIGVAA